MLVQTLQALFKRDLEKLAGEVSAYKDERRLWITDKNITNSAGNLCLHLVGNLNTYIGAVIGKTGYVRNRELEFSQKGVPAGELISKIEEVAVIVDRSLSSINETDLDKEYPMKVFGYDMTTGYFLVHLAVHLGYHLGQINYHRRLLDVNP